MGDPFRSSIYYRNMKENTYDRQSGADTESEGKYERCRRVGGKKQWVIFTI